MTPDLRNWPQVDFKGLIFDVPLPPRAGKRGAHVCDLGGDECVDCFEQREKQDVELRARMMELRGAP